MIKMSLKSHRLPYSTQHICPKCGKDFTGRRNRIYCSMACKVMSNNDKAAEMNFRVIDQIRMLKINALILEELYSIEGIPLLVEKEMLINKGFIMDCPTIRLKVKNEVEWHMIGRFIIRPVSEGSEIQIMTRDDLEKL